MSGVFYSKVCSDLTREEAVERAGSRWADCRKSVGANIVAILKDLGVVQFQSAQQVIAHAIGSGVLADVALSELEKSGFEVRRK